MTDTPADLIPDVEPPADAVTVTDWVDLEYGEDAYRVFNGPRRGFDRDECARRGQYIEAYGLQNRDGTLDQLAVRAELDVWDIGHYAHSWEDELTPAQAREWAQRLIGDAHKVLVLADAFMQAAAEVEGWAAQ